MPSTTQRIYPDRSDIAAQRSPLDWCFGLFAALRAGEGRSVLLFFSYAFLLLVCYYVLKLLREPLLLADGSAQLKSYAQAVIALVLMLLVPLYGAVFNRTARAQLVRWVTGFFMASLAVFFVLGRGGLDVGFAYYVWVGVFGVTILAQFWAHAAHSFDVASGQRVFPIVMAGATFGGLAGPPLVNALFPLLGPWNLMLLAMALLGATVPLVTATRRAVPAGSRNQACDRADRHGRPWDGFALVMRDRYLLLLAALVVLLNCVNTTGEYLLTELVLRYADEQVANLPTLDKGGVIAAFYSDYFFMVNALTTVVQVLLVGRIFRWIGVHGALLVLPLIAAIGYGLIVFVPIFSLIRIVKIVENSVDYSVMNTARQALFLPLPVAEQYQGKTAIDAFFWRFGDVAQAAIIYGGLNWLGWEFRQFAVLNMLLALVWIAVATQVARQYAQRTARATHAPSAPRASVPSRLTRRRLVGRVVGTVLGLAAATAAANVAADPAPVIERVASAAPPIDVARGSVVAPLFGEDEPLEIELVMEAARFCRNPQREGCADAPGTLIYHGADGSVRPLDVTLRARGRWRKDTADCRLPALFVFFDQATAAGTPFAGESMLPLTTHCRDSSGSYEQYLLKEYLAYRIYALLTDKSLRVRLAKVTYREAADPLHATLRYGFFTEHFDSLAARQGGEVWRPDAVDLQRVDPQELATMTLFQYLIGNTDWSAAYGHNIVAIRDRAGAVTVAPYDFDFSGLVAAEYAGPPPGLPIRNVQQRLFRGFCAPAPDWTAVFDGFGAQRGAIARLAAEIPGLQPAHRDRALAYVETFFAVLDSPERRAAKIVGACRP